MVGTGHVLVSGAITGETPDSKELVNRMRASADESEI